MSHLLEEGICKRWALSQSVLSGAQDLVGLCRIQSEALTDAFLYSLPCGEAGYMPRCHARWQSRAAAQDVLAAQAPTQVPMASAVSRVAMLCGLALCLAGLGVASVYPSGTLLVTEGGGNINNATLLVVRQAGTRSSILADTCSFLIAYHWNAKLCACSIDEAPDPTRCACAGVHSRRRHHCLSQPECQRFWPCRSCPGNPSGSPPPGRARTLPHTPLVACIDRIEGRVQSRVQPAAYILGMLIRDPSALGCTVSQPAISPDGKYAVSVGDILVNATGAATPVLVTDLSSGKVRPHQAACLCRGFITCLLGRRFQGTLPADGTA